MRIEIIETGEQFEVIDPYIVIKNSKLYNNNTKLYEAVSGDIISVDGKEYHVDGGYTNYQVIPTGNGNGVVLTARDGRFKEIQHNHHVKEV